MEENRYAATAFDRLRGQSVLYYGQAPEETPKGKSFGQRKDKREAKECGIILTKTIIYTAMTKGKSFHCQARQSKWGALKMK